MSNHNELAAWQTDCVCEWLDNDMSTYEAYIDRIERLGLFDASSAKRFVRNLWGDRTPADTGMSRVRWGVVAACMNSGMEEWIGMNIREMKFRSRIAGNHFFSKDSLRFFDSIVYPNTRAVKDDSGAIVATVFVTSEKFDGNEHAPRLYSVRRFDHADCTVHTVGIHQGYLTLKRALEVMRGYKLGDNPAPECDPHELNSRVPVTLETLPGDDIETQLRACLADLEF